jgi:hypothetical protein
VRAAEGPACSMSRRLAGEQLHVRCAAATARAARSCLARQSSGRGHPDRKCMRLKRPSTPQAKSPAEHASSRPLAPTRPPPHAPATPAAAAVAQAPPSSAALCSRLGPACGRQVLLRGGPGCRRRAPSTGVRCGRGAEGRQGRGHREEGGGDDHGPGLEQAQRVCTLQLEASPAGSQWAVVVYVRKQHGRGRGHAGARRRPMGARTR